MADDNRFGSVALSAPVPKKPCAPLRVEGQPPRVHKAADAEAGCRCGLLPLSVAVRMLCCISVAVPVAGVVTAAACAIAVRMAILSMVVSMAICPMAVLRCLSSLQHEGSLLSCGCIRHDT